MLVVLTMYIERRCSMVSIDHDEDLRRIVDHDIPTTTYLRTL